MQCPIIKEYHPHPWMMRAPLVIPHPSKKQHIQLKVQTCIWPSLQLIWINNHSQQLTFFCPCYPCWSFTYPSLHLTIPQKYLDSLLWVTTTRSKKEVKQYFPDWHSKNFCPRNWVLSLTVPSLHLTILPTYIDSFEWLMTIGYHLVPMVNIG